MSSAPEIHPRRARCALYGLSALLISVLGLSPVLASVLDDAIATYPGNTNEGSNASESFGAAVAVADFNDDGELDLLVGAPSFTYEQRTIQVGDPEDPINVLLTFGNAGKSYYVLGPLDGESSTQIPIPYPAQDEQIEQFGTSVGSIRSFDAGSTADAVIGAPRDERGVGTDAVRDAGSAYVLLGQSGASTTLDIRLEPTAPAAIDQLFGQVVAGAGTFDEDTFGDIVVAAPSTVSNSDIGRVYVFHGSASPDTVVTAGVQINGENIGDLFGQFIASGADIIGSAHADIVVSAPSLGSSDEGRVYILAGHDRVTSGPEVISAGTISSTTQPAYLTPEASLSGRFTGAVAMIGDVNGDGREDFAIRGSIVSGISKGVVYVVLGGEPALSGAKAIDTVASKRIDGIGSTFGETISAAGDLNRDGFDDFVVSSPNFDLAEGRAWVFFGGEEFDFFDTALVSEDYTTAADRVFVGPGDNSRFGTSLAPVEDSGAFNLPTFVAGAPAGAMADASFFEGRVYLLEAEPGPEVVDVTDGAGINLDQSETFAAAPMNFDRGGVDDEGSDLFVTLTSSRARLLRNIGVRSNGEPAFEVANVVAFGLGSERPEVGARGVAVSDRDNDDDDEMFVCHETLPMSYRNDGPTATPVFHNTIGSGLAGADSSVAAAWGDYDRDGYLDLLVARAGGTLDPAGIETKQMRLFRNRRRTNQNFLDVTSTVELPSTGLAPASVTWVDVDHDGDLDIFVPELASNRYGELFANDGDGTFTKTDGTGAPAAQSGSGAVGTGWYDVDRDGDLDMVIAKALSAPTSANLVLCLNDGAGRFLAEPAAFSGDLSQPLTGLAIMDSDDNGTPEIIGLPGADVAPYVYAVEGPWTQDFVDLTGSFGVSPKATFGAAVLDADGDGDNDLFLGREIATSGDATADLLYVSRTGTEDSPSRSWLGLRLQGAIDGNNRDGIGARVHIRVPASGDIVYERVTQVGLTIGRGGQEDRTVYFGLGTMATVDAKVTVTWPDGYVESKVYTKDNADQTLRLNGVRTFEEGAHAPGIQSSSLEYFIQPQPGQTQRHVIRWKTSFNTFGDKISVQLTAASKNGPTCWDPGTDGGGATYLTLNSQTTGVTTSVNPLAAGGYICEVILVSDCTVPCTYTVSNPSAERMGLASNSTQSVKLTTIACLQ